MSIERVQRFLAEHAPETTVTVLAKNTATVALAAEAFGVESGQIAKTLSFRVNGDVVLLVMAAAPALAAPARDTTYVVKPGDTLYKIARLHGTTVAAIVAANNLAWIYAERGENLDRALELGKPIMAVKVGRSEQARAAAIARRRNSRARP